MRQSFPLVIKDFSFNKISLLVDGVNGQLSDIDFYNGVKGSVARSPIFHKDVTSSSYFKKNPMLTWVISSLKELSVGYIEMLEILCNTLEIRFNRAGTLLPMFEVMKNALFGRLQYPHPYFIEKGVHSLTMVTQNDSKRTRLTTKQSVTNFM